MHFKRTFQTAGYVSPLPYTSSEETATHITENWQWLAQRAKTRTDANDYQDRYKTYLHGLMHNRAHQQEN